MIMMYDNDVGMKRNISSEGGNGRIQYDWRVTISGIPSVSL